MTLARRLSPVALLVVLLLPTAAAALPRFAARNGGECIQCHVNPTGGGIRNGYGRNVFEQAMLPWSARRPRPRTWLADDLIAEEKEAAGREGPRVTFTPDLTSWLAVGADVRTAYLFIRPDRGPTPGAERDVTSSFFLMQADLYHAATLNEHLTLVLDVGIYSGFEAWGLLRWHKQPRANDLLLKVGRFTPAFGIREVEHQLFTREGVGLGASDRDTGVELTAYAGRFTLNLALVNGTLGDTQFDAHGSERRAFEKAVALRLSARGKTRWIRGQLGLSAYLNRDVNQPNPLFGGVLPPALAAEAGQGLNELRAGAFATANLGRFTYLGDLVYVTDDFYSPMIPTLAGYASYQELSFVPAQGLELVTTFEFKDPDIEVLDDASLRAGLVVEFFPWAFTEARAMVRRTWSDASATGGAWDAVLFAHFFL